MAILAPFCDRIEIGGSLRRQCHEANDVEIIAMPRTREMFAWDRAVNQWPAVKGKTSGRYTQRILEGGVKLDLFMQTASTWACNLMIRTGCAEFSKSVVTHALSINRCFHEGQLWATCGDGLVFAQDRTRMIPVADERDVFEALELPWVDPHLRIARVEDCIPRPRRRATGARR